MPLFDEDLAFVQAAAFSDRTGAAMPAIVDHLRSRGLTRGRVPGRRLRCRCQHRGIAAPDFGQSLSMCLSTCFPSPARPLRTPNFIADRSSTWTFRGARRFSR